MYHSTPGVRVIKKKRKTCEQPVMISIGCEAHEQVMSYDMDVRISKFSAATRALARSLTTSAHATMALRLYRSRPKQRRTKLGPEGFLDFE